MTIAEFWRSQQFSYLATYSFNRGPKLAALHQATSKAIEDLKQSIPSSRFMQQIKLRRQLAELEKQMQMGLYRKRLTNQQLIMDSTADQVAVIKCNSLEAKQVDAIFRATPGEVVYAACPPVYRDALAFYDEQGQLLRVLNICFGCLFMETNDEVAVGANVNIYEALRKLFIDLGHPIEDHEH
ncbi:hypothetical protein [Hymenobacter sp. BT559]|uniref:hypothetical protein n=1 Tax=Hymenobacter sp. BT559 TaxID=2795729 RepID=UPI0018EDF3A6|nr:hypothetical protein [Hymenobacter sp. BT559]MBJ6142000.1 hypothetical protein [Hymenobacter sp. BT559]